MAKKPTKAKKTVLKPTDAKSGIVKCILPTATKKAFVAQCNKEKVKLSEKVRMLISAYLTNIKTVGTKPTKK